MLLFLASVLEQLDLALDHVTKGDVHNARFSLMLTDNAAELMLHQIAKRQEGELKSWSHMQDSPRGRFREQSKIRSGYKLEILV